MFYLQLLSIIDSQIVVSSLPIQDKLYAEIYVTVNGLKSNVQNLSFSSMRRLWHREKMWLSTFYLVISLDAAMATIILQPYSTVLVYGSNFGPTLADTSVQIADNRSLSCSLVQEYSVAACTLPASINSSVPMTYNITATFKGQTSNSVYLLKLTWPHFYHFLTFPSTIQYSPFLAANGIVQCGFYHCTFVFY